jgi:hypothetical protein
LRNSARVGVNCGQKFATVGGQRSAVEFQGGQNVLAQTTNCDAARVLVGRWRNFLALAVDVPRAVPVPRGMVFAVMKIFTKGTKRGTKVFSSCSFVTFVDKRIFRRAFG